MNWISVRLALSLMTVAVAGVAAEEGASPLSGAPVDPAQLTLVKFGSHSHWLQPWRGYLETMPASHFLDGLGIVLNTHRGEDAAQILRMCASNGIRHARIEIGWGNLDFDDETRLRNAKDAAARLLACRANGIRPLILLNGHHGAPCPLRFFDRTVRNDAPAGSRELQLDRTGDLIVGHSGLNSTGSYVAADILITKIAGDTVTLSKPLPGALAAGARVRMATLKYAPFGDPATAEGRATLEGWKRYARTIARFAAETLGATGARDLGFDLEIWNEMSFGSQFINLRRYHEPPPTPHDRNETYLDIVRVTAEAAEAEPALFAGVRLVDGFANTLPWPASSQLPARVDALSHHPYAGRKVYPRDARQGTALDALGRPDRSGFVPAYEACFPEYFATALQTETIVRDMAPLTTDIYRVEHGRLARPGRPCWCWITEVNYDPGEDGVKNVTEAKRLKAKAVARYYCFYLNKGVQRLYLYAAGANEPAKGDLELGVLRQDFVNRTIKEKGYPADDAAWTSPALLVVRRLAERMRQGLDAACTNGRPLRLGRVADAHGATQFAGDPADPHARPPLFDRDVFAFLPFQVNARRFVIPYYVMTRDIRRDLPPETFVVSVQGFAAGARFAAWDPLAAAAVPVRVLSAGGETVQLELTASDAPRLLEVQE